MLLQVRFDAQGNLDVTMDGDIPQPWLFQLGLKLCSRAFLATLAVAERAHGGEIQDPRIVPVTIMPRTLG